MCDNQAAAMGATIFLIKSQFDESESDQFTHSIDPVQKTRLPTVSPELDAFQQWGLLLLLSGCPHSCGPKYVMFGDTCKCSVLKESLLSGAAPMHLYGRTLVRYCLVFCQVDCTPCVNCVRFHTWTLHSRKEHPLHVFNCFSLITKFRR